MPTSAPAGAPTDPLIDRLIADLSPVRVQRPRDGIGVILACVAVCVLTVGGLWGLRADVMAMAPPLIVVLRSAALLMLGFATLSAAIASARPGVGGRMNGWQWTLIAAGAFPALALWSVADGAVPMAEVMNASVPWCFGISLGSAAIIGGVMAWWLRRGAVTETARAAWLTGIAAGAFGTFAYSLHCPHSTIAYTGLWYSITVGLSAVGGRLLLPPLLRW